MLASVAWNQVSTASAQEVQPVGIVVAYLPGQSITIVDEKGIQSEFAIDPSVKIQPPEAANSLKVGSFVTIIAPASISKGKQIAVGIVIKPDVPEGLKVLVMSATPLVKDTPESTQAAATEPSKDSQTTTLTGTPMKTSTDKSSPTATPKANTLIEWLKSLLRQLLGSPK